MNTGTDVLSTRSRAAEFERLPPLKEDAAVITLVGLAHASSHFAHLLLPALFPIFMREFSLSFAQLGFLSTVFFVISSVGQALAGFVVDRFGPRPALFGAVTCFFLACVAGALAQGYPGLMLMAVLAGLGNAPFHPIDYSILNQRVSAHRLGYAFSVHGLTGNLGWALAPVFLAGFAAMGSWRLSYGAAAIMYAAILLTLVLGRRHLQTRRASAVAADDGAQLHSRGAAFLKLPVVWWCFAFFLLSTMAQSVVQNFVPSILNVTQGVGFEAATTALSAYMLCGAAGILAGGFVAVRWPMRSDHVVAMGLVAGAALLVLCATGVLGATGSMAALAATGFAIGVGGPSRDMMIKKATPRGATGRVYGMVYSGMDVGSASSPLFFGLLMDRGWYAATLVGAALALMLAMGAALGVGRRTEVSRQ